MKNISYYRLLPMFIMIICISMSCLVKMDSRVVLTGDFDKIETTNYIIKFTEISKKDFHALRTENSLLFDSTPIIKFKNELVLPLINKKNLVLKDSNFNIDRSDQVTYTYKGFYKEIGFYLVIAQYYETGEYLLINNLTGAITKVWGKLKISPNLKQFVCYSSFLEYNLMPTGIQMWEILPNRELKLNWEYSIENWEPIDIFWTTNKYFYVTKYVPEFLSITKLPEYSYLRVSWKKKCKI